MRPPVCPKAGLHQQTFRCSDVLHHPASLLSFISYRWSLRSSRAGGPPLLLSCEEACSGFHLSCAPARCVACCRQRSQAEEQSGAESCDIGGEEAAYETLHSHKLLVPQPTSAHCSSAGGSGPQHPVHSPSTISPHIDPHCMDSAVLPFCRGVRARSPTRRGLWPSARSLPLSRSSCSCGGTWRRRCGSGRGQTGWRPSCRRS